MKLTTYPSLMKRWSRTLSHERHKVAPAFIIHYHVALHKTWIFTVIGFMPPCK